MDKHINYPKGSGQRWEVVKPWIGKSYYKTLLSNKYRLEVKNLFDNTYKLTCTFSFESLEGFGFSKRTVCFEVRDALREAIEFARDLCDDELANLKQKQDDTTAVRDSIRKVLNKR